MFCQIEALNRFVQDMDADHETALFYIAVQWLTQGNMLARVYELKKEVKLFLEAQENQNLVHLFTADRFQLTLLYFVDIFEALSLLNQHLQDSHNSRIDPPDSIRAFIEKIKLWF